MGREVRRVPEGWQHPSKKKAGGFIPLFESDKDPAEKTRAWLDECRLWQLGEHPDQIKYDGDAEYRTFTDWDGGPPNPDDYMPYWPEGERTHWQMYENTTEGTPISPVMETPEALARWLADNDASAFGDMTATYGEWLRTIKAGWAPSAISAGGELDSGVAFVGKDP